MKFKLMTLTLIILALQVGITYSLTLDEALNLGRQRSLRLETPRLDRMKINGQVTEAWSNALPQVEVTAALQTYWKPSVVFFTPPGSSEPMPVQMQQDNGALAEATLNQPLFTFGRVGAGLNAAWAARKSNDHLLSNTVRSLELDLAKRFWTVLLLSEVVEARRSSLAISDSSLRRVQRMRDVGMMSDYDVLRVQVQANNQIPQFQQAQNNLRLAELSLKELMGVPVDTALTIEGSLSDYLLAVGDDTSVARLESRDDLEALRDLTDMYRNLYVINRNARLPILAGQVKYSWMWSNNEWAINPRNNVSSVYGGIALTIPLWTSGKVAGQAQQSRSDWQRAQLNLTQAQRGARLQYEAASSSYHTALSSEEAAQSAVSQAQAARSIAQTKLAQGQITPLEMDAARLDELVARVALAQARYDRLSAAADARMALGLKPYTN
jgi:outer membrane protein TolC